MRNGSGPGGVLADVLELNGSLRPYLTVSAGAHALLAVGLALGVPKGLGKSAEKIYRIDFVGESAGILNRERGGGAPPAAEPKEAPVPAARPAPSRENVRPMKDPDEFPLRPSLAPRRDLPPPSFASARTPPKSEPVMRAAERPALKPAEGTGSASGEGTGAAGSGEGGGADVSADIPDFPYPWYLQRLRASIWDRWSSRMPAGPAECGVVFTVLRDGRVVDLQVEHTSGDAGFDFAALSAVKDSSPFQPLPPAFDEKFLKVHVQFKAN